MKRFAIIFLLLSGFAVPSAAQADRAILSGTVTDPSGASITGASIELTNTATGLRRTTVSGDAGSYSIGSLTPGVYKAVLSHSSFQTVTYDSLSLVVGESRVLNVQMQIASTAQETHVEASVSVVAATGS